MRTAILWGFILLAKSNGMVLEGQPFAGHFTTIMLLVMIFMDVFDFCIHALRSPK